MGLRKNPVFVLQFVKYAVYASVIALDRGELHDKVVKGSEIAEVMHGEPQVQV